MKKITIHAAIIAALATPLLEGCIRDADKGSDSASGTAVKFSTTISATRAYDNLWENGDIIGVFMLPVSDSKAEADSEETLPLYGNMKYSHDLKDGDVSEEVVFSGIDDENTIVWPDDGNAFDFVAYYPWRSTENLDNFIYQIDISDQSSQQAIDLMYSDNVKDVKSGSPALKFTHLLTKLVFNVTDLGDTSLEEMVSTFEGLPALVGFNLVTGEMVPDTKGDATTFEGYLALTTDAEEEDGDDDDVPETAVVEAIVLPGEYPDDYTLTFELMSGEKAVFTVENPEYEAGNRYISDVSLKPRSGESATFGADGKLNSITPWNEITDEKGPHEIPKTGPDEEGEPSTGKWDSGILVDDSSEYTIISTDGVAKDEWYELPIGSNMTIKKKNYADVVSVTLSMKPTMRTVGHIRSVTVDGAKLIYSDNVSTEKAIGGLVDDPSYITFHTGDGKPISGDIEIFIESTSGSIYMYGFSVND